MIGRLLYTKYIYLFQLAGMVLFVAMVGAIVLTLRARAPGCASRRIGEQVRAAQRGRRWSSSKCSPGSGV